MTGYIRKQCNSSKGHIFLDGKLSNIVTKYNIEQKKTSREKNQSICFLKMKVTTSEGRCRKREKAAYTHMHTHFRNSKIPASITAYTKDQNA